MQGSRWTLYLPSNQVLELLDLFMGLRVLLQVPVCKEGLVETRRVAQCTCSANTGFCTVTVCQALRIELASYSIRKTASGVSKCTGVAFFQKNCIYKHRQG